MEGNRAEVLYPNIVIFQYAPVDVLFVSYVLMLKCWLFLAFLSMSWFFWSAVSFWQLSHLCSLAMAQEVPAGCRSPGAGPASLCAHSEGAGGHPQRSHPGEAAVPSWLE